MARRPGPSFRALLFRSGEGAVCEPSRLEDRQLRELVFLSVQKATLGTGGRGPQARSVLQSPAVSVWRRRRLWAFAAGRQTAQRASFLVGSESNVMHWGPWPAGPVRPSRPCCLGEGSAPCPGDYSYIRSLWKLFCMMQKTPRTTRVGGRGRSPLIRRCLAV